MPASNYFGNIIINLLRGVPYTPPATLYIALYLTNPGPGNTGTEVSGVGYARQEISLAAPSVKTTSNSAPVDFGPAGPAGWGTVAFWGLFDAPTGGNLLQYGPLTTTRLIEGGTSASFETGEFVENIV